MSIHMSPFNTFVDGSHPWHHHWLLFMKNSNNFGYIILQKYHNLPRILLQRKIWFKIFQKMSIRENKSTCTGKILGYHIIHWVFYTQNLIPGANISCESDTEGNVFNKTYPYTTLLGSHPRDSCKYQCIIIKGHNIIVG